MSTRVEPRTTRREKCATCAGPLPSGRRIYCCDDCARQGDQGQERERRKAREEVYKTLGLPARSEKPTCNELVAAGYDRYCPICERVYKPGEEKRCGCSRGLWPIEWHIPRDADLAQISRGFL